MPLIIAAVALFWVFLLFMTGARFLILLLNANRDSEIVDWILRHSDFWVKPFFDLLNLSNKAVGETGGFFEPASAIAFFVYFIIGAVVLNLLRGAVFGGFSSGGWGRRGGYHHA
jgi:hypothetical protein